MSLSIKSPFRARSQTMNLCLVPTLLLLGLIRWTSAIDSTNCPDQYVYTIQPPGNLFSCNPYDDGVLSLSCRVIGRNVTDIKWWFTPQYEEENTTYLMNGTKYALSGMAVEGGLAMQLTIKDLGEGDAGTYWCQASVVDAHGVQLLSTSESLILEDREYFDTLGILLPCGGITLKNSKFKCASVLVTETASVLVTETASVVPTTLPEPTTSPHSTPPSIPPLTSHPSPSTLSPPSQEVPKAPGLFESSSSILYAVLGLVGFLAIVCFLLVIIVVVLCRRKCGRGNTKGDLAEKEMGFEQFSHESDMPLMYKHTLSSRIIHSDTHSRNLSGDYAEIGPALANSLERGYSLIGVSRSSLPPIPTETDPVVVQQVQTPSYENPYDLPNFPTGNEHEQRKISADWTSKPPEVLVPAAEETDSQSRESHEYHMLEQIAPLSATTVSSPSPSPLTSPHHTYHTLEAPNSPPTPSSSTLLSCDPDSTPNSFAENDDVDLYDDIIQPETSQSTRLSCGSAVEPVRLPTIPENELEGQTVKEFSNDAVVLNSIHPGPTDTVSPDFSTMASRDDCTGFSESSKDDEEYDRLVDPPHLYHILDHSALPGSTRVHNFAPAIYSNLEAGISHVKRKCGVHNIHLLTPQSGMTNLTYSSGSSLDASENNIFDDMQYFVGPPGKARVVVVRSAACNPERKELRSRCHSYTHGHPLPFDGQTNEPLSGVATLSKYSGDYERDPVYMKQLYNESENTKGVEENPGDKNSNLRQPLVSMDDSFWHVDSMRLLTRLSLQDREKGSSLPNLTKHIYQSLAADTLEPLQPYDRLNKNREETAV